MQAVTLQNGVVRPAVSRRPASGRAPSTVASVSKGSQETEHSQGPSKLVMQTLGAIAAASLAAGPIAGPAFAANDINEGDLAQQAKRSDQQTSNLPTFKDIGKALGGQFGGSAPDPSAAAEKASGAADQAATKVQNATPDLSQGLLDRATKSLNQISQQASPEALTNALGGPTEDAKSKASDTASAAKQGAQDAGKKAQNAVPDTSLLEDEDLGRPKQAADKIGKAASDAAPDVGSAGSGIQGAVDKATGGAKDAVKKAQNAAPDLSQLPDPSQLFGKAQGAADQAAGSVKGAVNQASGSASGAGGEVAGSAKGAADQAKGAAGGVSQKAQNAAPDLSQLPDPSQLFGKAQGAADQAAGSAKGAANQASGSASGAGGELVGSAKGAADQAKGAAGGVGQKAQNAAPDLSGVLDFLKQSSKEDAKAAAEEFQTSGGQKVSSTGGPKPSTPDAKALSNSLSASGDNPPPNVGADVELSGNLDKGQFKSEMGKDASADSEPLGPNKKV